MIGRFLLRFLPVIIALVLLASTASAVVIDYVRVGDPGNVNDDTGYGSVDYVYYIGKYEVTNVQYCEFLNAVAADDLNHLYSPVLGGGWNGTGGITRSGSPGSYTYSVRPNRGNRPVNDVVWYDTLRFANWLHNGQPTGPQGATTTEDGAYDMSLGAEVVRNPDALVFLPTEDEWYKAAYYKGGGVDAGYWEYPTQSDTAPTAEAPPGTDMTHGSANYYVNSFVDPVYYLTAVGAYDANPSSSSYGTFDQGGNVWEWNETAVEGSNRGRRGGGFSHQPPGSHLEASHPGLNSPPGTGSSYGNLGFRLAASPELFTGVLGRHVFYNNSTFDDPSDEAIAIDKAALLPGQTATFENYTSYDLGINGIMVDISELVNPDGLNLDTIGDYFQFRVGNDLAPDGWDEAPGVRTINVRPGEGSHGSDRVTITWADREIQNEWLQVTVLANDLTGLEEEDIFYFGNAVAEAGNSAVNARVTVTDLLLARNNPRSFLDPAGIDYPYDYNRDQRVDTTDVLLARNNPSNFLTGLRLITAPGDPHTAGAAVVPEPTVLALVGAGIVGLLGLAWRRRFRVNDS